MTLAEAIALATDKNNGVFLEPTVGELAGGITAVYNATEGDVLDSYPNRSGLPADKLNKLACLIILAVAMTDILGA